MGHEEERQARLVVLKRFWTACESGDVSQIKSIYRIGLGQKLLSSADATRALTTMIRYDHVEAARSLLELGAEVNDVPSYHFTQVASRVMLETLGEFGLDFEGIGGDFIHAFINDRSTLEWLLQRGADINGKTRKKETWAPSSGHPSRKRDSCEALNQAAAGGNVELFDYLVTRGAQPSLSNAIHRIAECKDPHKADVMVAHLVDKHKFDVNMDQHGRIRTRVSARDWVPLRSALAHDNVGAAEALLRHGADPTAVIGHSIMEGNIAITKLLLEAGADAAKGYKTAVLCNDLEAIRLCVDNGAELAEFEYMSDSTKGFLTLLKAAS